MSGKIKKDWKKFKEDRTLAEDAMALEEEDIEKDIEREEEEYASSNILEHPSYRELEEKLTVAEQKAHENWEMSVRFKADAENARRRAEREVVDAQRYGAKRLLESLVPVMDSIEQALQLAEKHADESMKEGLVLTMKLFMDVFEKNGIQQIDPQGAAFDPQEHEAMSMQDNTEAEPNTVVMVFQKGYKLHDRVIRPARVIVAK